jgi:hypothetical protein
MFVENIRVNGGTEIREALRRVFVSRNKHIPTSVFVLTDGEVDYLVLTIAFEAHVLILVGL